MRNSEQGLAVGARVRKMWSGRAHSEFGQRPFSVSIDKVSVGIFEHNSSPLKYQFLQHLRGQKFQFSLKETGISSIEGRIEEQLLEKSISEFLTLNSAVRVHEADLRPDESEYLRSIGVRQKT